MFNPINIFDIIIDGHRAISGGSRIFAICIYWITPIIIASILWYFGYYIPSNITSDVISGIGLFAGLMFTLLFVVTTNYKNRKQQLENDSNEETKNYIRRYHTFTESAVALISYSIVKAGIIIFFTIVYNALDSIINNSGHDWVIFLMSAFLEIFWIQFIIVITRILREMYVMLYDDIEK